MEHKNVLNSLNEASDSKFFAITYNDAYILVRGGITATAHNNPIPAVFKNFAPLTKCNTEIDGATTDDTEDLELAMLMYNLLEYSSNYSDMTVYGFNLKMKQLILMLILGMSMLLNLSKRRSR